MQLSSKTEKEGEVRLLVAEFAAAGGAQSAFQVLDANFAEAPFTFRYRNERGVDFTHLQNQFWPRRFFAM